MDHKIITRCQTVCLDYGNIVFVMILTSDRAYTDDIIVINGRNKSLPVDVKRNRYLMMRPLDIFLTMLYNRHGKHFSHSRRDVKIKKFTIGAHNVNLYHHPC